MEVSENFEEAAKSLLPVTILKKTASTLFGACFLFFFLLNRSTSWIQKNIIFLHFARWPLNTNFKKPETCGIKGARNLYVTSTDDVKVGVWHILPTSLAASEKESAEQFDAALAEGKPIIVYAHGNSGTRATPHRVQLYKRLQLQEYHIIAFDYRSYGDSTAIPPDELGVVADTTAVIRWVLARKGTSPVFVWGHSLGTGIGSRTVTELEQAGEVVDGLILEAPFNCLKDAVTAYPLTMMFRHMIGFEYFVVNPIMESGLTFKTEEYLANSKIPLLILHAEDDWIVPFTLGQKLYRHLLKNRENAADTVKLVRFGVKNGGYGHKFICECPMLIKLIDLFQKGKFHELPSTVD